MRFLLNPYIINYFFKGIFGSIEGGIYYFNISEKFINNLAGTLNIDRSYSVFYINDEVFLTINYDNIYKVTLWNIDTAEELQTCSLQILK